MTDATEGIEVWRGVAAPGDCDEAGRLSARALLARGMEGLAGLAAELGMADAFAPSANSTLSVREHHVRVLAEVRAGAPLAMTAGVLSIGEDEAELLQVLRDGRSGAPCAALLTRVAHISVREPRVFAWSARTRAAAAALAVEAPGFARPDALSGRPDETTASREQAVALGLPVTGRGVVQPHECDVFGRLRPDAVMARCEQASAHLQDAGIRPPKAGRAGRILAEAHILYLRSAAVGARLELRSAAARGLQSFTHWLLDPESGEAWASAVVLGSGVDGPKAATGADPEARVAEEMEF